MVGIYRGSYFIVYFPLHLHQFSLLVKVVFNVGFATRCAVSIKHSFFVPCTSHATIHPPQIIKTTTQRWGGIATATEKSPNTIVEYRLWNTNTCILGRMYLTVKYIFKYLRGFNLTHVPYIHCSAMEFSSSPWPAKMAIHFAKTALHSGSESTPIALWTGPLLIDRWLEISLWKVLLVESWWNAHQQSLFQEDAAGQA